MTESPTYRGRFAPTPSGPLHFGSLTTALASWLDARYHHGEWWLRVDDIDPPRQKAEYITTICRQLETLGLVWDKRLLQHSRYEAYRAARDALLASGEAFYCDLSRRQLREMNDCHPGISVACAPAEGLNVRLAVPDQPRIYGDLFLSPYTVNLQTEGGAFVVWRRNGMVAYQLACAVDDGELGITHVIRGRDLLASTPRQQQVMHTLGLTAPTYGHLPLMVDGADKLSKSTGSADLDMTRPAALLWQALHALGQRPPADLPQSVSAILDWGVANWSPERLPQQPVDIHQL